MTFPRLALALAALLLAGCKNTDMPDEIASVFVEASSSIGGSLKQEVRLPVSGVTITVLTRALVPAEEILGTQPITSGDPDLRQEFLLVQLVLVINSDAVGIMPIDRQISDGNLMFHVEKKGLSNTEAVMDISKRLNISALKVRKIKEAERK
jgi:hypothetical protein